MRCRHLLLLVLLTVIAGSAAAQAVTYGGSVRARAENWSWFETPGFDDDYTFLGMLVRASAAQQRPNLDWQVELAAPILVGVPDGAIAPAPRGQLGFGGSYYGANRDDTDASVFAKQAFVRFKSGGHALRVGRFEFIDGTEVAPKNPVLAGLKSGRVAHRLIGNFGFSNTGRSADGVHYAHNGTNLNLTAAAFRPTVGAFRVDGMGEVENVTLLYGSATWSRPTADERLFVIGYRDSRDVVKTDNRPAAVRAADRDDIDVVTIGGHYLALFGNVDVLAWGAWQTGTWGTLDHNAAAIDLEAGYHFAGDMKPVLRGGIFRSTGDDDAADGDHETFFQVLPTPRIYARFPFYNAMNSTDAFVQFSFKPTAKVTIASEAHALSLTEERDLWYAGGGAFEKETFGFAGRPSGGSDDLARTIDVSVDHAFNPKTSMTFYAGLASGGDVVESIFDDGSARYLYLEVTRRF